MKEEFLDYAEVEEQSPSGGIQRNSYSIFKEGASTIIKKFDPMSMQLIKQHRFRTADKELKDEIWIVFNARYIGSKR